MKAKKVIRFLEKNGFRFIRQKGSHRLYRKGELRVTVPFHGKDLKHGTYHAILKQAGVTKEELEEKI